MKEAQDLLDETWYSTWVRALHNHHNALLHQNATCWGQRAKAQWLNNGDQNSSYFQNSVKIRHHRNKVGNIKDTSSNTFSTHSEIETCFLFFFFFFKSLWSSSSSHSLDSLSLAIPDDLVVLNEKDRVAFVRPISKREVLKILKSMPHDKSLGLDGLNVDFYIFYWKLIGDHFFLTLSLFFLNYHDPSFLRSDFRCVNSQTREPYLCYCFLSDFFFQHLLQGYF